MWHAGACSAVATHQPSYRSPNLKKKARDQLGLDRDTAEVSCGATETRKRPKVRAALLASLRVIADLPNLNRLMCGENVVPKVDNELQECE